MFLIRLAVAALATACLITILALVATSSKGADFRSDWLLEDLTCEELLSGYSFNVNRLQGLLDSYTGCVSYYRGENAPPHGDLHCALIRKEGEFLEGFTNDIVGVFNTKCSTE